MSTAGTIVPRTAQALQSTIAGDVFVAGDAGYDAARRAFFLNLDQRPSVVVVPESVADVVRAVGFARVRRMRIAPQGTGHGAPPLEPLEGAMLLRTTRMRRVEIDPVAGMARVEAGAEWRDVTIPAAEHGLAALAGTAANVGVAGYTLGGGIGWLGRRYGLAANSVTAVELVTPDGRLARADATHEPDLFWAVRGGGGSVGVVTALEMTLYPVRELYAGVLFFGLERASEMLHTWRDWTRTVPDEVTSIARIMRFPPLPEVPEPLRGRAFALVEAAYLGDAVTGADLLRPLRRLDPELDTFATVAAPMLQTLHMDPDQPVPAAGDGGLLSDFADGAIDAVLSLVGPDVESPLLSVEIRHLGGALARSAQRSGAQSRIDAGYLMYAAGLAPTPELEEVARAHARALKDALAAWRAGYDYYNLAETPAEADAVLPRGAYRRLQDIKAHYDPDQAMISAHPVRPAGS